MAEKNKHSNDEIFDLLSAIAVDIEAINNNLEYLEQRIDRLPEPINASFCKILQEHPLFKVFNPSILYWIELYWIELIPNSKTSRNI